MKLIETLVQLGLSERESTIYLALLKKVEATVYAIAKATKIPRTTAYETLELMKDRGIVSASKTNGILYFTAESPNRLLELINEKEEILQDALPFLLAHGRSKTEAPRVELYLGEEGMKRVYMDMFEELKNTGVKEKAVYAIVTPRHNTLLPSYFQKMMNKRREFKIFRYLLAADDGSHTVPDFYKSDSLRETRLIPERFLSDSSFDICAGKVAIYSEKDGEIHSILIESAPVADMLKKFFMFMWEHAHTYEGVKEK